MKMTESLKLIGPTAFGDSAGRRQGARENAPSLFIGTDNVANAESRNVLVLKKKSDFKVKFLKALFFQRNRYKSSSDVRAARHYQ